MKTNIPVEKETYYSLEEARAIIQESIEESAVRLKKRLQKSWKQQQMAMKEEVYAKDTV